MPEITIPWEGFTARATFDEDAIPAARALVAGLRSPYLDDTVLARHTVGGRSVLMIEHINLVLTLELPRRRLVGLIFAELEPDANLARLHILYVLRAYRRAGNGRALLQCFDSLLTQAQFRTVLTAPVTHASLALFESHKRMSQLTYDLRAPSDATLSEGDLRID